MGNIYNTKSSDSDDPVLEFWGMWDTPSLLLHSGPLCLGLEVTDRVPSMEG